MNVRVECYAGYRGEETPRVIFVEDKAMIVSEIRDRWMTPEKRYFRIRTDDGRLGLLYQETASGEWNLIPG
jgi:hypothetical protein